MNGMHILLIGGKPGDVCLLRDMLAGMPPSKYELEQVHSIAAAITCLKNKDFDLAMFDLVLSESEGDDTFDRLKKIAPHMPIIVLAEPGAESDAISAVELEAQGYLVLCQLDANILKRSIMNAIGRKQTENALIEIEEKFRAIAASAQDGIVMMDHEGLVSYWNSAAEKIFGYSSQEAVGQELHHMLAPARYLDDSEFPMELSVSALAIDGKVHALGIVRDITERQEMQQELTRSEKFAVMGQLAGGIAHELRNPLGTMKNAVYFLEMALINPKPEIKEMLNVLANEVSASTRIIDSLLQFARPDSSYDKATNCNQVLQEVLSRQRIPLNIDVETHFEEDLPSVLADPDQLHQAFGNIILNAVQSMPAGGKLTFRTSSQESHQVAVTISDTGTGIPSGIRKKLFEPFFTTKSSGIGLGLALTKLLIEKHGGTVTVDSKIREGSIFTVSLPEGKEEK
jgi:signal transduction histidine kinase